MNSNIIIVGLVVAVFALVGILYSRNKSFSVEAYISARKSLALPSLIATIVATSMGAWILFSPAETTILSGFIALVGYAFGSAGALLVFIWLGTHIRQKMPNGHSLTEFVYLRYGKSMYVIVLLTTIFYMAIFLTAELTGIALALNLIWDIPLLTSATIVGIGTLLYTSVGGIRATVFTDKIQTLVILPVLAIVFVASALLIGGLNESIEAASKANTQLFNLTSTEGILFGITLIIAIISAEVFNQAGWQRVFIANTTSTMRRGFFWSALIVIPIILIAGFFGVFAIAQGAGDDASVALFTFLEQTPSWVLMLGVILAIALVMSSMDSLVNGIVSLLTVDLIRMRPKLNQRSTITYARITTVLITVIAVLIATQGYSVLYIFLIADLLCAAAVFPTFYGLFAKRFNGTVATIAVIAGVLAGAYFFPTPDFSQGNLLYSFVIALLVPAAISVALGQKGKPFDFKLLSKKRIALEQAE